MISAVAFSLRMLRSIGVDRAGVDEIGLVDDDAVGRHDLVDRLVVAGVELRVVDVLADVHRIDQRHDRIEVDLLGHLVVDEEGRGHRRRIGEPAGLDDDVVELLAPRAAAWRKISIRSLRTSTTQQMQPLVIW